MAEEEAPTTETSKDSMSLLAKNLFGDKFHGEVDQPAEDPEQEVPEETEQEVQGEEADETEASQEETETGEEAATTGDEPEYQEYELPHLAQLFGVDEDRLDINGEGRVVLVGKVDGESRPLPVKDLLDNVQMYEAADKRLEDAKAKVQTQNQEFEQKQQQLEQQFVQAGKLIENAENLIDQDSKAIDWKQLREDDPAEYSAKKAELAERKQEIDRMKQEAVEAYQKSFDPQQDEEQRKQALQAEHEALLTAIPEWKEPEKAQEGKGKLAKYLIGQGFTEQDVQAASDHRLIVLAHKARLYDEGQKKTDAAKKKVAKVPKAMKPGAAKEKQQADSKKVKEAQERFRKNPTLDNAYRLRKAKSGG